MITGVIGYMLLGVMIALICYLIWVWFSNVVSFKRPYDIVIRKCSKVTATGRSSTTYSAFAKTIINTRRHLIDSSDGWAGDISKPKWYFDRDELVDDVNKIIDTDVVRKTCVDEEM